MTLRSVRKLRRGLMALVIALPLLYALFGGIVIVQDYRSTIGQAESDMRNIATTLSEHAVRTFGEADTHLRVAIAEIERRHLTPNNERQLHEILAAAIQDVPQATFYIWLDLTSLDPPLPAEANISDGLNFFNALLSEKVIVVPGIFFDLNPAKRRDLFDSPCHHFVRLSYGPKMDVLKMGLDGIERVIKRAREAVRPKWEDEVAIQDD